MTRINTNVSSLVGRNNLSRANAGLSEALTRLSTGLRINTGKDDPAGLIASENLRSDITSIKRAISNTERAEQVIATADSALGQVSSLLNDIRGLVTESANAGALSDAQVSANQSQVDSSLEALNRIAQTTTFQGRKLLDGSLDFTTTAGSNFGKIQSLQIDQANLGATGAVPVSVNVSQAATKAQVNVTSVPTGSGTGIAASTTVSFNSQASTGTAASGSVGFTVETSPAAASSGSLGISLAETQASGTFAIAGEDFDVTALAGSSAAGLAGNSLTIALVDDNNGNASATAITDAELVGTTLTITGDFSADSSLLAGDLASQVNAIVGSGGDGDVSFALASGGTASTAIQTTTIDSQSYSGGRDASTESITLAGVATGTSGNISIDIAEGASVGATPTVTDNGGGSYTINIDNSLDTSIAAIASAINGAGVPEVTATYGGSASFLTGVDADGATVTLNNGAAQQTTSNSIDIQTLDTAAGGNLNLTFVSGATAGVAAGASAGEYTVTYTSTSTLNDVLSLLENGTITELDAANTNLASGAVGTQLVTAAPAGTNQILGYTAPVFGNDVITIEADSVGTAGNGKTISIVESTTGFNATTNVGAVADSNGNITVTLNSAAANIDINNIANAISDIAGYTATVSSAAGSGIYDSTTQAPPTVANTSNGAASGGLAAATVIELAGTSGSEVLSFGAGTSLSQLVDGINLVADATGVEAVAAGTTLQLRSVEYGSEAIVDLKVISEGSGSTLFSSVAGPRDEGTDVQATVNGVIANGKGNQLQINTATLDVTASIEADFEGTAEFTIVGGGALFQLGADVVSNQQARLGIGSVNTARLGGVSGKLYELQNGNAASLENDANSAARIVEEAIDQVTSLRGRLGAFQRTTLETNRNALNDTLANLTAAESAIRDADFAEETANLTRSQILVQSGTRVLQIANQNPQNVLALLG